MNAKIAKDELQTHLDGLAKKYLSAGSHALPPRDELDQLQNEIIALGKAIGIRRFSPTHMWGVIKAIDRRYKKLGLIDALNRLVDKVTALPAGPLTRIKKQLETQPDSAAELKQLAELIEDTRYSKDYTKINWGQLYKTILPFTTDQFRGKAKKSFDNHAFEHDEQLQRFQQAFGWAAFVDVQRQHLLWKWHYWESTNAAIHWFYHLMNPDYHARLVKAFYGAPLSLDEFKRLNQMLSAKARQQKRRKAKKQIHIP